MNHPRFSPLFPQIVEELVNGVVGLKDAVVVERGDIGGLFLSHRQLLPVGRHQEVTGGKRFHALSFKTGGRIKGLREMEELPVFGDVGQFVVQPFRLTVNVVVVDEEEDVVARMSVKPIAHFVVRPENASVGQRRGIHVETV